MCFFFFTYDELVRLSFYQILGGGIAEYFGQNSHTVVRSQGHSDPFAMFIENVVQPGRDLTTASRI